MMINMRTIRLAKGLTQEQVSKVVGVNCNTICQWERGSREPDFSSLIKLADFFKVSVDFLLDRDKPEIISDRAFPIVKKIPLIDPDLLTDLDEYVDFLIKKQKQ